ncbi:MAG TPA: arginine deiminase-related protein [Armatimonadota bacterium]|nr:arginine deiminase-related protein [Armatimonadota bacterium]
MRLLMCPPTHYSVVYEINPWMSRSRPASRQRALGQWERLHHLLGELRAEVECVEPRADWPDMVFTANAGLVRGRVAIPSRFRHPERRGEEPYFRSWFQQHGYDLRDLPEDRFFEGEGDALFCGDTLFAGYFWRSDVHSHRLVGEILGVRVLSLQLTDPHFYHLDTCFCPLGPETAAYYPPAFDEYAQRVLAANIPHLVAVEPDEAERFACNAVVLGKEVALNTGCPRFEEQLRGLGFRTHATPLDEFLKAGGSAKCLTLHLDHPELDHPEKEA